MEYNTGEKFFPFVFEHILNTNIEVQIIVFFSTYNSILLKNTLRLHIFQSMLTDLC